MLSDQIKGNIDVLLVSETKIDDSFPNGNFLIEGFSTPYRLNQNSNGGGLMLFVREDIPSNLVEAEAKPIEGFYIELNLRNDKWLLNCSYNLHKNNIGNHLKALSDFLDSHSSTYEKVLILGDFNVQADYQNMKTFRDSYSLTSLIKRPTCYKNPSHPKCIDLILTNVPRNFQTTCVIETRLSVFHLMTLTVMRKSFKKLKPSVMNYSSYKNFSNEIFRESLLEKLSQQTFVNNDYGFEKFCNITLKTLDKYAPRKAKHARGNQIPFMTNDLSKNIMKKVTATHNKYLNNNNEENRKLYAQQRNYCVSLLRKTKKVYYEYLDERKGSDNKLFWKAVKPSLFEKVNARERISLIENSEIMKTEKETAEVFYNFFGNIVKNLNISQYSGFDAIIENVKDPTLKAILKYKKHPSILAIRTKYNRNGIFSFREVIFKEIETEIRLLKLNKASQYSDIPTKIIKENSDTFSNFICESISNSIKSSIFPSCLKDADATPLHKKCNKSLKENYGPVSILPILSKVFERSMFKQMPSFFDDIFSKYQMASEKVLVLYNVS